jgi:hypothetical protein
MFSFKVIYLNYYASKTTFWKTAHFGGIQECHKKYNFYQYFIILADVEIHGEHSTNCVCQKLRAGNKTERKKERKKERERKKEKTIVVFSVK